MFLTNVVLPQTIDTCYSQQILLLNIILFLLVKIFQHVPIQNRVAFFLLVLLMIWFENCKKCSLANIPKLTNVDNRLWILFQTCIDLGQKKNRCCRFYANAKQRTHTLFHDNLDSPPIFFNSSFVGRLLNITLHPKTLAFEETEVFQKFWIISNVSSSWTKSSDLTIRKS